MREWCGCGAGIHSRSKRAVKDWRANHYHDGKPDPETDKNGSEAMTERRGQHDYDDGPRFSARIGFQPSTPSMPTEAH